MLRPTTREICEQFAKGNLAFSEAYLSGDIKWNIPGESLIIGKEKVLEVFKMSQLETFPVITIKNIVAEGNYVVIESSGEATTKTGSPDVFEFVKIYFGGPDFYEKMIN